MKFGVLGKSLPHTYSPQIHKAFADYEYTVLERSEEQVKALFEGAEGLDGFNVTIPYKKLAASLCTELSDEVRELGAANTIVRLPDGGFKGYNTDVYGFDQLLNRALNGKTINHALVLGTGGASKAVQYVLKQKGIPFSTVSRSAEKGDYTYDTLSDEILRQNHLIINTTPLGMAPQVDTFPDLHYQALSGKHILIDLIYNPKETAFMELGKTWGAKVYNGMQMFEEQAKKTWEIFNDNYGL
jgi:shikimate dehydrogenase